MTFSKPPDNLSALPLTSTPIIVLDTETTGLDVKTDRLIEIGAVRVLGGFVSPSDQFSVLVNPDIPIPPQSTRIHGLSDSDVEDADKFKTVMFEFSKWVETAVIIGYSIGYDLAILKSEHERHGMDWQSPRCIDIRHLVQILTPNLPSESLEIIAEWLGIEVTNRHRALGDAMTTAHVLQALLPKLAERGIRTLAQAERVSRSRTTQHASEIRSGWHEVAIARESNPKSVAAYARIDSYPYRHIMSQVMKTPPLFIDGSRSLQESLARMIANEASSLFLPPDGIDNNYGIITERDILRAIDTNGTAALGDPTGPHASRPLVTVNADEFVYRAITSMSDKGFRHLGVMGASGDIVGALSARDLLKQRASEALSLGDSIDTATSPAELGTIWFDLITVVKGLIYEDVDPRDVAAVISRELRALTRRACQLAEADMVRAGHGIPPTPYAMLVLGSGGRGESLLAMDQDNAIVFAEGDAEGPEDKWFEQLGQRVADTLDSVGVEYCKGGVMARNATWRKDLNTWMSTVQNWVTKASPEDILSSDIFFDAMAVHGDFELADRLRRGAFSTARRSKNFLKFHTLNAANFQVPVGLFGRLKTHNGRIDIKRGGIMPIFSTARVLALKYGLDGHSTPERLEQAAAIKQDQRLSIYNLIDAHKILLDIIVRQQLRDIDAGIPLSNSIAPSELSSHQTDELRWALGQVTLVSGVLDAPIL